MINEQKTIRLEYYDHNERFNRVFPSQNCEIIKRFPSENVNEWFLIKLSQPFIYDKIENTHLLIRSRWQNYEIGSEEPTSVFILLISDYSLLKEPLEIDKFRFSAWGMAYTV